MNVIEKVNCLNKKCTLFNDDERMVTCWLCHGLCHFKCSGLSGLVADALRNNTGLHWCCFDCRKIGVEFYRFFQGTKSTFTNIQIKMDLLSKEFAAYGNLFDDFKNLNSLNSPPQSSPKRRKSSRIKNKDNTAKSPVSCYAVDPSNAVDPVVNVACNTSNPSSYSSVAANYSTNANNPQITTLFSSNTSTSFSPAPSTVPSSNTSTLFSNTSSTAVCNTNSSEHLNSELVLPKQLKAIPKNQHIFLSRCASDTTIE